MSHTLPNCIALRARTTFFTQWIIALAPFVVAEMTDLGARTRQTGTFPVNRENISPAQNAGLPEVSAYIPRCFLNVLR
jgi:hypothetical protein